LLDHPEPQAQEPNAATTPVTGARS
jgi:hypothetical protein